MTIDHCVACNGTDLYQVRMIGHVAPVYIKKALFETVSLTSSVCLNCGVVIPHVNTELDLKGSGNGRKTMR